jgi:thiol-disulfide isomerase/thioredoxin
VRKTARRLVIAGILIAAVALAVALTGAAQREHPAPALPRRALIGAAPSLASLRGRPAVVDFFASWCGPCTSEAPALEQFARAVQGRAAVVAVAWSDSRQGALRFVRRFHWTFPVLNDPNGAAGYAYGIQGLPTSFVLDARGRIVTRLIGPQTRASLLRALRATGGGRA